MKKGRVVLLGLVMFISLRNIALAGPIPSPLQGVSVSAMVGKDQGAGIFTYRYRVFNPATNDGHIWHVDVEISRGSGEAELSREGLVNGPRYKRHSSEDAFQRVGMVPVGITGPSGWIYGLGFDESAASLGFASWGAIDDPSLVLPGRTLEGFQLTSYGPPGLRLVEIQPDIDTDNLPEEFSDPEKVRQLRDNLIFRTKTIGPKAPPQNFVPLEFLNYLITLLHDSRQLGWIKVEGVHKSLLAKLLQAKRALEKDQTNVARNTLDAFLNEVKATSCREFSCPGNTPLTSEAYALLFFNGQFLLERLP